MAETANGCVSIGHEIAFVFAGAEYGFARCAVLIRSVRQRICLSSSPAVAIEGSCAVVQRS